MGLCVAVLLKDTGSRSELKALLDGQPGLQLREVGAGGIEPEQVVELNPALQRQGRQRQMATWLLPFGFGAGMVFTFIQPRHLCFRRSYRPALDWRLVGAGIWLDGQLCRCSQRDQRPR